MRVEFDQAKDQANRSKHGVSLAVGFFVLDGQAGEVVDPRHDSEERLITFGLVGSRLFVCVWTLRGDAARIISVRKANKKEQRRWLPGQ
ncbi:BrnT family toxin [Acidisoma cladoniae]|uniref:BrnT family toxin n=1 Tax=Acidisoma cladoniae TaxID=3040935 RepID=UPI00254A99E9|nr:BrnT family toxin [Acidisoma sp. PAMC 29798]